MPAAICIVLALYHTPRQLDPIESFQLSFRSRRADLSSIVVLKSRSSSRAVHSGHTGLPKRRRIAFNDATGVEIFTRECCWPGMIWIEAIVQARMALAQLIRFSAGLTILLSARFQDIVDTT